MFLHEETVGEGLATDHALVGFLASVNPAMLGQARRVREGLRTELTLVWFLSSVDEHDVLLDIG